MSLRLRILLSIPLTVWTTVISSAEAQAPYFEFAKRIGAEDGTSFTNCNDIAVNTAGNTYVTGFFNATVDFDPGSGTHFLTTEQGYQTAFVSKFTAHGGFVWAKKIEVPGSHTNGLSIALDSSGNAHIVASVSPSYDSLVCKIDTQGNFIWIISIQGTQANSITLNSSSEIIVTGEFAGTVDFDPGISTNFLISQGFKDGFVSKFDLNGDLLWASQFAGTDTIRPRAIEASTTGEIYTVGNFTGTADFDPGAETAVLIDSASNPTYVVKLDDGGNLIWARSLYGVFSSGEFDIDVDATGNLYMTGAFHGYVDFDPGPNVFELVAVPNLDTFVCKFDSDGNLEWARQFEGGMNMGNDITIDEEGDSYISGLFEGTVDFDPGVQVYDLTSDVSSFIAALDNSGNALWAISFDGPGSSINGKAIAIDPNGNVYSAGIFSGVFDFDPGSYSFFLGGTGFRDVYLSKLRATPLPAVGGVGILFTICALIVASGFIFWAGRI